MPPQAPIQFGTPGEVWPSGRSKVVALLEVEDAWVAETFGAPLLSDFEDGLGPWVGSGGRLRSGAMVELVRYEHGYDGRVFELRVDHEADAGATLSEFISAASLEADAIKWRHPEA